MKLILPILILLCFLSSTGFSQSNKPSVLSSAGGSKTVGDLQVSWTLGETFTQSYSTGSNQLTQGFQQVFPSLEMETISSGSYCSGQTIQVSFIAVLIRNPDNVFSVQLSNTSGDFSNPVEIGNLNSTNSGSINATIPESMPSGTGYRIRIISTNPALVSKDNGTNLIINSLPDVNAGTDFSVVQNSDSITLSPSPSGGIWSGSGVSTEGVFNASLSLGSYPLSYCYTNEHGCARCDTLIATITEPIITEIATPIINPPTGTYPENVSVTITCATPGATIYFTTSGNLPVLGTGFTKVYSGPFQQIKSGTIRAMAVLNGLPNSKIAVSFLTITNPGIASTPIISPGTGSYSGPQTITLSTATSGASIYFTTNGNLPRFDVPNSFTKLYTGPFQINTSVNIKAIVVKSGIESSAVASAILTITNLIPTVSTPIITPTTGIYAGTQNVSISCVTPGAIIYYTTSGNTPVIGTGFTKVYAGSFNISSSVTVRAMATAQGMVNSGVAVSFITIGAGRVAVNEDFNIENDEEVLGKNLRAFPNPTSDIVHLVSSEPLEMANVEVFNAIGQSVLKQELGTVSNESISVRSLPAGIYNLRLVANGFSQEIRVVKL